MSDKISDDTLKKHECYGSPKRRNGHADYCVCPRCVPLPDDDSTQAAIPTPVNPWNGIP